MTRWVEELLHTGLRFRLEAERVLYEGQTPYQRVVVLENATFGRVMVIDDIVQTTERDEFIYHEMLSHVPILAHGAAREVLIVGGGDGGMLEETLKHGAIERVTMVDIDAGVIELAKTYLRAICKDAFEDPRTDLVIADGVAFVARCERRFDVIIVDSTDPVGPGVALFGDDFYRNCRRCLAPGGIVVAQDGLPFLQSSELINTHAAFRSLFADASCYLATVPAYVGGPMAFGWGTDNLAARATPPAVLRTRFETAGIETDYYTPEVHVGAFTLPAYIARMIS
ncbi:MAG: polyamine aminopropyltransferase [Proteobacteria bacterium]|nr:polyamine aminopropyltransferase [Pseudomonadota bacterium]